MFGTSIAQAIPFLFSPLLSRLYTPADYALLGIMLASSNIFFEFSTLKYDRTIVLEENKSVAINLFLTCTFLTIIYGIFLLFILFFSFPFISNFEIHQSQSILVYILPPIILCMSIVTSSNYWFQRIKEYYRMTINKIVQMVAITLFSILLGYYQLKNGLTIGYLLGWGVVFFFSIYQVYKTGINFSLFSLNKSLIALKKYNSFPKYNLLPSLLNVIAIALPFYLVTYIYGEDYGGQFNMCKQLLMIPCSFVSIAFIQVYYRKFAEAVEQKNTIKPLLYSMLKPLLVLGLAMLIVVSSFGDVLFKFVLGNVWEVSGKIAMTYVFAVFFQFIGVTLMIVLPVLKKVKQESAFKLVYFIAICLLFLLKLNNQNQFILVYSIIESILYLSISIYCIVLVLKTDKLNAK
jgi:O-antigen/teichoic acid export membrane protein